jgi:ArsR family transcriptional regulator
MKQDEFKRAIYALNDLTRLEILHFLLQEGEKCVCEIETALALGHSRLSRHLKILREGGFVAVRRVGTWGHYSIEKNPSDLCAILLDQVEAIERAAPARADAAKRCEASSVKPC